MKKDVTTDIFNNLNESPENYAEREKKKAIPKSCMTSYALPFHLCNILEITKLQN